MDFPKSNQHTIPSLECVAKITSIHTSMLVKQTQMQTQMQAQMQAQIRRINQMEAQIQAQQEQINRLNSEKIIERANEFTNMNALIHCSEMLDKGAGADADSGAEEYQQPKRKCIRKSANVVDNKPIVGVKTENNISGQLFDRQVHVKTEYYKKRAAKEYGGEIDVSDENLIRIINLVNDKAKENNEEGSNNCEVQAARVVCALQGGDLSKVSMRNEGIEYKISDNAWGYLRDSKMVQSNYKSLIEPTIVTDITGIAEVIDVSDDKCVTDVMDINAANGYFKRIEQEQMNWGLIGLKLVDGWHQAVWIKRAEGVVICDPNRGEGKLTTLKSYPNLNKVSILKFVKGYCPEEAHTKKSKDK